MPARDILGINEALGMINNGLEQLGAGEDLRLIPPLFYRQPPGTLPGGELGFDQAENQPAQQQADDRPAKEQEPGPWVTRAGG